MLSSKHIIQLLEYQICGSSAMSRYEQRVVLYYSLCSNHHYYEDWITMKTRIALLFSVVFLFGALVLAADAPKQKLSLNKLMTKEEQRTTGVSRLSARELAALEEWLTPRLEISDRESDRELEQRLDRIRSVVRSSVKVFDTSLRFEPSPRFGEGYVCTSEIQGRIRNQGTNTLSYLFLKISVFSPDKALIDTEQVAIRKLYLAPGDVKSFSENVYIDRVPVGFSWTYSITFGGFN